jgi:3-oxoacyl-[acyl-carrier protein] reductase
MNKNTLLEKFYMINKQSFKRALILGGSCQLALALLPSLLKKNIQPLITYRNLKAKERIKTQLGKKTALAEFIHLDLCDRSTLLNLEACLNQGPDYLVDYAHSDYECLVASGKDDDIQNYFFANVSVRAMILRRVIRSMLKKRFGRLVFVSSTAAKTPNPGQGFYCASKSALEALYRSLGIEMASKGITTAIVRPGYVDAGRGKRYLELQNQRSQHLKKSGQIMTKEEVNNAILFLLLTAGTGVNGSVLTVDGGMTIGKNLE